MQNCIFKCINKQLPAGRVLEIALASVEELSLSIVITVIEYLVASCKLVRLYIVLSLLMPVIVLVSLKHSLFLVLKYEMLNENTLVADCGCHMTVSEVDSLLIIVTKMLPVREMRNGNLYCSTL